MSRPPLAAAALVLALLPLLPAADEPAPEPDMTAPFPHPKGYVCERAASPIAVDGDITDAEWKAAPWTDDFIDIEGDKKPKPRFRTRVKMLWDDEALYIAAEMEEPHVWATLTEHDAVIFHDPDFEVFLDPDGDNHAYGELELNALNTTWDLLLTRPYKDGGRAVNAWEITGLKTAVKVKGTINDPRDKDTGWAVEIRWPWKGLQELTPAKLPPKDGEQIRINFSRVEWDVEVKDGKYQKVKGKPEHNWVWSPQGLIDMHRPERWGYLQFNAGKPGAMKFRPDPDWATRDALHRVYYAQREHRKAHGKFAAQLADLKLKDVPAGVQLEATRNTYEASAPGYTLGPDAQLRKLAPAKDGK
ncbi:MAG: carbohydrate-binding family 9-like protein [Gemmataceae bacterium]|nr:carbohydrate-binding family 9-like protein [Gemmataceae bacterium]